jgi:SAM-dependent methyltransferase
MEGESASLMEEWLLPRYGWVDRKAYDLFMRTRHRMLDAGCGLGREALRMARSNVKATVVGLELSHCVDEALEHARDEGLENAFFAQGDLMSPPFRPAAFDFIMSEGVLHHTEDTRAALQALAALLRSSGQIGFYVYRKKAPLREYADDYVRELLQNRSPDEAWNMMESLTKLGKTLADLKAEVEISEDVAVLGIRAGRYDIQRLIYYTMFKCYWNDRLSFDENVHVNFDWYTPRYASRHTIDEVRGWIEEAGLTVAHESVEESGITIRAELAVVGKRMP